MSKRIPLSEVRQNIADTIKGRIDAYEKELVALRARELKKSVKDLCPLCGNFDTMEACSCLKKNEACAYKNEKDGNPNTLPGETQVGVLPGDKKPPTIPWEGSGGEPKKMMKKMAKKAVKKALKKAKEEEMAKSAGEPPMAKPPTQNPAAPHPTSKPSVPKVGGMMKGEAKIPGLELAKSLAAKLPALTKAVKSPEDTARAAAGQQAFTPTSANTPVAHGAVSEGLKEPKPPHVDGGQTGKISRFTKAYRAVKNPL